MVLNNFSLLIFLDYFIYFFLFIFLLRSIFILYMSNGSGNGNDMFKFNPSFNSNFNPDRDSFKELLIALVCIVSMTCIAGVTISYFTNRSYVVLSQQVESNTVLCNILIELLLIEKDYYNFSSDEALRPQVIYLFSLLNDFQLQLNFKDLIYIFHEVQTKLDDIAKITSGTTMTSSSFSLDTKMLYYQVHFQAFPHGTSQFVPKTGTISLEEQEHYLNLLNQALKELKIRYKLPI